MKRTLFTVLSTLTVALCADGFNEENLIVGKDPFPVDESYLPEGDVQDDSDDSQQNNSGNKTSKNGNKPENKSAKSGKDVYTPDSKAPKTKTN